MVESSRLLQNLASLACGLREPCLSWQSRVTRENKHPVELGNTDMFRKLDSWIPPIRHELHSRFKAVVEVLCEEMVVVRLQGPFALPASRQSAGKVYSFFREVCEHIQQLQGIPHCMQRSLSV